MPSIDLGQVVGPTGATGPQGPQGIQGNPGPNQITSATATNLNGVLAGSNGVVGVRSVDSTPDSLHTTNLITSAAVADAITGVESDLASIHATGSTNTTGAAIQAGAYFYLNGVLVRAKTDIASGAAFTSGTNYAAVTAGGLNELQSGLKTRVSFKKYQSTTASSFQQIVSNRWAIAADDVQTKIASASRGMTMLEVSTSPTVGGAMVYKYNDSYWTAFLFTYGLSGEYAIATRENTGRTIVAYMT